ncbi:MAG: hypothetical protein ABSF22_22185 [Bryobacteraceae bacterium]
MTRTTSLAAWTLLACATAFAASRAETTTYVDGNLTGVSPNTGGTLLFSDDNSMSFRTGLATVSVPYAAISKAELGATRSNSHDVAFYKVWAHHKKTETQFLTVEFKNEEGESRNMTLELAQASAPTVLATIQDHRGGQKQLVVAGTKPIINPLDKGSVASPATKAGSDWWGDDIWKTHSNATMWPKPAGTTAPQE